MHNKLHKNIVFLKGFLFFITFLSFTNVNSQLREWFKIYADEEGAPARFDHICINVSYNGWIHNIDELKTRPYSIGYDFGIYKDIPLSKTGKVTFAFGLSYGLSNVYHNGDVFYTTDTLSGNLYTNVAKSSSTFIRNKLFTQYLEIPLEFRFRKISNPKIRFYLGFKTGVLLGIHTTRVTNETKYRIYRIKNRMPYRYGPTLKIGVGKINLYGFYSLTPLFEVGKGEPINQFSLGMSFFIL